jgi:uncharacterized protein (DUF2252 family)
MKNVFIKLTGMALIAVSLFSCAGGAETPLVFRDPLFSLVINARDPVKIVHEANKIYEERDPALIAQKYSEMKSSRFAFYRATAYLFYQDIQKAENLAAPFNILLQGDLHLENLGTYLTVNRQFSFDLNDFDDAFAGSFYWELARCAVSIRIAASDAGLSRDSAVKLVKNYLDQYFQALEKIAANPSQLNTPLTSASLDRFSLKALEKVSAVNHQDWLKEIAPTGKFLYGKKIRPVTEQVRNEIIKELGSEVQSATIKDVASRTAGIASLGKFRYIILLEGTGPQNSDDIILEIKEATPPSAGFLAGTATINQAERIRKAFTYFLPSNNSEPGIVNIAGNDYFSRELLPDENVSLNKLKTENDFAAYLETVALITARAHARSGRLNEILRVTGKKVLEEKIIPFSDNYFGQVNMDYEAFRNSV